jgi:hypothetical protein
MFVYIIAGTHSAWSIAMKNITVTLDEKMAVWLRQNAAQRGVSVSRFLGDLVHERMREAREYNEAKRQFLAEKPFHFGWIDGRKPTREEIHDRARARDDLAREESLRKEPK